jgi:diguanylate cyclase (GGDEF)-like protein
VLTYLREHVPLAVWSVSRVENDQQTYLYLVDNDYGMVSGTSLPWGETFCVQMVAGAPTVAPDVHAVPVYDAVARAASVPVGAYAGSVITEPGGALFGALCGFDPEVQQDGGALAEAGPLLQLLSRLLSIVLAAERWRDRQADALLRAQLRAETDSLTGVFNRRAWQRIVDQEEARLARYADPLVAVVLDLDGLKQVNDTRGHAAGDRYIQAAAAALTAAVRESDTVARLGGDEFGVLLAGCPQDEAAGIVTRIHAELDAAGVAASVGWTAIEVSRGMRAGLAEADAAMYATKARRREAVASS